MKAAFRWVNRAWAAALLVFAALQLNDPDPMLWVAAYAAGAACCLSAELARGRLLWLLPAAVGAMSVGWGLSLAGALGGASLNELFGSMDMKTAAVEESREALGLFLQALWMAVVTAHLFRRGRRERVSG